MKGNWEIKGLKVWARNMVFNLKLDIGFSLGSFVCVSTSEELETIGLRAGVAYQ